MKFAIIFEILRERLSGADAAMLLFGGIIGLIALTFVVWRWGVGSLIALPIILVSLQITKSNALNGIALFVRFLLIIFLAIYALLSRKNRLKFSPVGAILFLIPLVMLFNSTRAYDTIDAFGQSILFFLIYFGFVIGGQRILGDERGRATFTKFLAFFSIVLVCLQVPFIGTSTDRLAGVFENIVGFMTVGTIGVITLFWYAMKQRVGSPAFIFFVTFSLLCFILLFLTGGRTALASSALGIGIILSRKLKRNMAIFLVLSVLLAPITFKVITSFAGFEAVRGKLFSEKSSGRSGLWTHAWQEIKQKPVIGWGTQSSFVKGELEMGEQFHNSFIQFAIEHGILFSFIVLSLFLWLPFRGLYLVHRGATEELKNMANLSSAFLLAFVFANFLGGGLLTTTGTFVVYTAIALQEGVYAENKRILLHNMLYEYEHSDQESFDQESYEHYAV